MDDASREGPAVQFQGIALTARQVQVLRNIVREAVSEFSGHPDHGTMVELRRLLLPMVDTDRDDIPSRAGVDGSPVPYGVGPKR